MITRTKKAEEKIQQLMQEDKETFSLRVYVEAVGAMAISAACRWIPRSTKDVTVVEQAHVKIIMDSQRTPLLVGTEGDSVNHTKGSGFVMKEPSGKDYLRMQPFVQYVTY